MAVRSIIRPARVQDVRQMARVHVRCWQETYRGLMPDAVLDDPGFPAARERMWTGALTSERYRRNRVAVAERDDELVGPGPTVALTADLSDTSVDLSLDENRARRLASIMDRGSTLKRTGSGVPAVSVSAPPRARTCSSGWTPR